VHAKRLCYNEREGIFVKEDNMDSDNIIREEGAGGTAPEEVMAGGFPPQEEPAVSQETAGSWAPDSGSAGGDTVSDIPAGGGFGADQAGDAPAGGSFGGDTVSDTPAGGAFGGGGYSGGTDDGPGSEPPVNKKSFIRACGSWTDILPIAALLSVLLLLFGSIISALVSKFLPVQELGMRLLGDEDGVTFLLQYFDFIGIWILFMLITAVFKGNWPMWKAYFYNGHGNNFKAVLAGILLGFGTNGFCILMSVIMGDIKLSFNEFRPLVFLAFLLCVWIQSGAEEIVDRCYLYQKLRRRYRWPVIAVLGNSLVFMALHMPNPGVTAWGLAQVFLIGVLFSLIIYYWDSLWTAIWAHTAWNFSQSIVFGLPNSGIVSKYSVFKLEAASARDGLFYSTSFGVEGSKGANAIIGGLIVIVLLYGLITKRGEKADHWEEMEELEAGKSHIWEAVVLTVIMIAVVAAGALGYRWYNEHAEEVAQISEMLEEEMNAQEQQPGTEMPAVEQPADQLPGAETPAVEQPAAEQPGGQQQPGAEAPAAEQPAGQEQQPGAEAPAAEQPAGQQPGAEAPAAEQPAGQEQQPAGQEQQPGAETPATQQPAGQQPGAEAPAAEQLPEQGSPIL